MNMKLVWKILLLGIAMWVFISYISTKGKNEVHTAAFAGLKLHLVGTIYDVDPVDHGYYHGFGIIRVRILSSNIQSYDVSQNKYFYCTIKDGKAEIYDHASRDMIGDTLTIDTERQSIKWVGKDGVTIGDGSISVSSLDGYYDYIRAHKQL